MRAARLNDTGFSSQDQRSPESDVVGCAKMGVKIDRNMLRMEVGQDLHLSLKKLIGAS